MTHSETLAAQPPAQAKPLPVLTASRMKDARACMRLHRYRYEDGYRPAKDADTLRFGTLVHRGLEAWWRASGDLRLDAALGAMEGESDPYELAKARALLVGYHVKWAGEQIEVLAVEAEFRTALINPETGRPSRRWELGGKIDAVVRLADGRVAVVEHKTSSEDITPGSDYWTRLRLDGQVSVYFDGGRALGHEVEVCLYDVIGKPGQRPYKKAAEIKLKKDGTPYANQRLEDETPAEYGQRVAEEIASDPDRYYRRGDVVRLAEELNEARENTWQIGEVIAEARAKNRWPQNEGACKRFGRTCEFVSVCLREASLDDATRYRKLTVINEELSQPQSNP